MNKPLDKLSSSDPAAFPAVPPRRIGSILLDAGKITPRDAERASRLQREKDLRFGEACIKLGLVTQADIDEVLSGQFKYPYLQPGQSNLGQELVAAYTPFSPQVEALRALRTQLVMRWFSPDCRIMAIASPARGDGRSHLAANLAVAFSQLGVDTLLIDADMRYPRQHRIFRVDNSIGLSAALAGRASVDCVERIGSFSNLSVLAAGAVPPNPVELLSRQEFPQLLGYLSRRFDVVLIDTPAAALGADALAVAVRAGGALLLARESHTRVKELNALEARITGANAVVVGSVFNYL